MASFPVSADGLRGALEFIEQSVDEFGQDSQLSARLSVIVDELVSNMIRHDPTLSEDHRFDMALSREAKGISARLEDPGQPFDPVSHELVVQPEIGGHGLRVIRGLASTVRYRRENGRNVLSLTVQIR